MLVQNNAAAHLNIGGGGLDVFALASSQGRDGASANALVDIEQTGISITGDILVAAKAVGGPNVARQTKAHANLTLDARNGGIVLGGNVNVNAQASSNGIHGALASALADLMAVRNVTVVGDLAVGAVASSHAAGNGALSPSVKANAQLSVHAGGSVTFRNSVAITAQEKGNRTLAGSAIAHGDIDADGNVNFAGDVLVQANALGGVAAANVAALASLDVAARKTLNLVNKADLTVNAHAVSSGTKAVTALALAHLEGNAIREAGEPTARAISRSPPRRWALATISTMPSRSRASRPMPRSAESCSSTISTSMPRPSIRAPAGCWRWAMRICRPTAALRSAAISRSPAISPATDLGRPATFQLADLVQLYQRFGSASLHVDAQHGDVSLGGVSVLANANLTATGTPHGGNGIGSLGTAGAWADAHIMRR